MPRAKTVKSPRNRTIRWEEEVDARAVNLSYDRRCKGGVSELLTRLVLAEAKRKRGIDRNPKKEAA